jgi:radical SAM protein with 4Fe4S-binding SPASM domain
MSGMPAKSHEAYGGNDPKTIYEQMKFLVEQLKKQPSNPATYDKLAAMFYQMRLFGEAYKAANSIPRGLYKNSDGVIKSLENPLCANLGLNLEIISVCNLRCPMCSNATEGGKPYDQHGKVMSLNDFKTVWDQVKKSVNLLILVGQGETFIHPQVYKILDYVRPTPTYIDTNGSVDMDAEKIVNSSISDLIFSLDGVDQRTYEKYRIKGDFDKVVNNIENLVAAKKRAGRGPAIIIKYIIFKHNEAYLDDIKHLAARLGVDGLQFVPCVIHPAHSRELVKEFLPVGPNSAGQPIQHLDYDNPALGLNERNDSPYCTAPIMTPQIKVNGDVTLCCTSTDVVGNVFKNSFEDIWNSETHKKQRLAVLKNRYKNKNCLVCARLHPNLRPELKGSVLEYPAPPAPSDNTLWLDELKLEPEYVAYLKENSLERDLGYFGL